MAQVELVYTRRWKCRGCFALYLGGRCPHCSSENHIQGEADFGTWLRVMWIVPITIQPHAMVDRGLVLGESFDSTGMRWLWASWRK